ncbi:hypothetical protein E1263_05520 [Kribbella antibiotica]|uniref:ATP-binding protein n=1 Tax=Kribbella antibiotica TaxID=190195 RepID=A0A4R4ZSP1_9ACTN|nr:hypothetical protein [Kribbella antibiotica]TDD62071.1 hypothetical protein E1263_05520 [Kribbella antibiotica]
MTSKSSVLRTELDVRQHYLRAAHIEHHEGQSGYIPTARGLEVLHRITRAMTSNDAGRAWSLTGPYGAGKSSFGLFLHALLGPAKDPTRVAAVATLAEAEPALADLMEDGRRAIGADGSGFIRAAATAQREPIVDTVLRALQAGARSKWKTRVPAAVKAALAEAEEDRTPRSVRLVLEGLAEYSPVLLVIDEFGKNLEHFADDPHTSDLFVLQELAERSTGDSGIPVFVVTLQHLAFDDYVRGANGAQRREWGKVQGRFEDIPFIEGAEQSARLVAGALTSPSPTPRFVKWRKAWAAEQTAACDELGLLRLIPGGGETIASCYPVHPITLLSLPVMCSRFGQHGRTLFSFLTGREPHSVVDFLDETPVQAALASVGVDQLFDFFVSSGGGANGQHDARLTEINVTIREATGLTVDELRLLKVVGVLNLLSQGGPLRASASVLRFALGAAGTAKPIDVEKTLKSLEQRGLLTYRAFADEYRIWRGSDLDLPMIVGQAREMISSASPAALLAAEHKMPPAIAGRHSQRVGMLRYFETTFADASTRSITRPTTGDAADGLVVYYIGAPEDAKLLTVTDGDKPVLVATTEHYASLTDAVFELVAVQHAIRRDDVQNDHVARRELQDRAADAQRRLTDRVTTHLRPNAAGVQFKLLGSDLQLPATRGLSPLLSVICDDVYFSSPEIRNEMLGRRQLTSQAAKARRELLEAMVTHGQSEWLNFSGFGPEKAMYAALLRHTEIHENTDDGFVFQPPRANHVGLLAAWRAAEEIITSASEVPVTLDKIYTALMEPPIGLKDGPIPVLITALLLHHGEDVAIYQEGTYQPAITPDLLERLVKSPARFSVKHFGVAGEHRRVIEAVASVVGQVTGREIAATANRSGGRRNLALLAVAGPLLNFMRRLPEYTLKTKRLSTDTEAVRDALLNTREPETLLFESLPAACGLKPFVGSLRNRKDDIELFENRLAAALDELKAAYDELLIECCETLAADLRLSEELGALRVEFRGQAASLTHNLLEPRLRSFVLLAAQAELDDTAWLEAIANNIATKPATTWRDDDLARFEVETRALAGAYRRVLSLQYEALAAERAGFDAHRVTMTNPDGSEHSTVVWVDHTTKSRVEQVVQEAQSKVEKFLGARGGEALLALLADSVLGQHDEAAEGDHADSLERKDVGYV